MQETQDHLESANRWGGKRDGAGRKSAFGESTKVVRVPESQVDLVKQFIKSNILKHEISDIHVFEPTTSMKIPLATERVQAGFPSPAQDYTEKNIDLNEFLIRNQQATFIVKANSQSMLNAGIDIDDSLIVDRSLEAQHRDIVIAMIDNEFTVKRLIKDGQSCWLKAENEGYKDIHPLDGQIFEIWGVVTNIIKKCR